MPGADIVRPDLWASFGPLGLVCLALFGLLVWLMRDHRRERREMREEANMRVEQMVGVQRETNLAMDGMRGSIDRQTELMRSLVSGSARAS